VRARAQRCSVPPVHVVLIGVALLSSLTLGHLIENWLRGQGFALKPDFVVTTVSGWRHAFTPSIVWEAFLGPLFLLVPATIAALWYAGRPLATLVRRRVPGSAVGCVLWWGIARTVATCSASRGSWVLVAGSCRDCRDASPLSAHWSCSPSRHGPASGSCALSTARGFQIAERVARVREHLGDKGSGCLRTTNTPTCRSTAGRRGVQRTLDAGPRRDTAADLVLVLLRES
jgi:hypothetical protein